jgi:ubiquitin-protein ligase
VRIAVFAAPGISASPSEENMRYFNVMILGPSQSPYEGEESSPLVLLFFILIALDIMYIFEL